MAGTIPSEKQEEIDSALAAIREEFNNAKRDFLNRYQQSVQEWIQVHPGWEEIIANSIVSEDYYYSCIFMIRTYLPNHGDKY